jgi:hypothetical protein
MYTIIPINEFTYKLHIQGDDDYKHYLYNSIQKIIKGSYIDDDSNSIYLSAEKTIPFKTFISNQPNNRLSYHTCIQLVDDLTKQIMILHKFGYGIYGFNINDILTIDNHFIFCSTQHMLPLMDDHFIFTAPIKRPYFSSPELNKLTKLPSKLNYKCCYYSLGTFVGLCLLNIHLLVEDFEKLIEPLHDTKIYWFIKNCTNEDVNKRILLFI